MRGSKRDLTGYPLIRLMRGGRGEGLTTWSLAPGCLASGSYDLPRSGRGLARAGPGHKQIKRSQRWTKMRSWTN